MAVFETPASPLTMASLKTFLDNALSQILEMFQSGTAPSTTQALMRWFNTGTSVINYMNPGNTAFVQVMKLLTDAYQMVGPMSVLQNAKTITLGHNGTDAEMYWDAGGLIIKPNYGAATDCIVTLQGLGSAGAKLRLQAADGKYFEFTVPASMGNDRSCVLWTEAPADGDGIFYDSALGRFKLATPPSAGGAVSSIFPGTLMNYVRAGTSAAPLYMYLTGTGASITMTSAATKTDKGWQAQITNGASNAARYGWNTAQNACGNLVDVKRLRGGRFAKGVWVYCTTADRVKLEVSDGTTTTTSAAYHAGGGWEWMQVALGADVDAAATNLTAYVLIEAGTAITIYVELPCAVPGTSCPSHVGYKGGGRIWHYGAHQPNSNGSLAITGCGFSPTAVMAQAWNTSTNYIEGGTATLRGATTYYDNIHYDNTVLWGTNVSSQAGTVSAWGSDGVTIAVLATYSHYITYALFEGYPE